LIKVKHDSITVYRLGFDLSRLIYRINNNQIKQFFGNKRTAYEGSFDFRLNKKIYPTIEGGSQELSIIENNFSYSSTGYYVRAGVDFNIFKPKDTKDKDDVFWGLRYGYGRMRDNSSKVVIQDPFWVDFQTSLPERLLVNHWVEVVCGVKAELFTNFFMGWTLRWRLRLAGSSFNNFSPYIIPGFGYGSNKSNIGFNYYIMYRLPF
jgi:hypothetical protein